MHTCTCAQGICYTEMVNRVGKFYGAFLDECQPWRVAGLQDLNWGRSMKKKKFSNIKFLLIGEMGYLYLCDCKSQ